MSVNDRNDWDDGLDFESLADEQIEAATEPESGDEEPRQESFDEDYADEEDVYEEPVAEEEPERPLPRRTPRRRVSGAGLGVLFGFSIIVAAVGIGGALVLALGIDPVTLWQPESFSQVDRILDLNQNPLNLVYIVTLATLLLTLLGGWGVARAVRRVGDRAARDAELLEQVAALRIDDERGWQDDVFRDHPQLSAFVTENLGTWRMQELRQKRSAGLEGELQRLTKAAAADERDNITDRYDHPAVGSMADEITRYYDERDSARREADAIRAKDRDESESIVKAVSEAAGWNLSFTDQVGVQGAAAAGLASRLRDLVAEGSGDSGADNRRALEAVNALRQHIRALAHDENQSDTPDLIGLADRGNKLAFQIAMEVARLGTRGERLLPMTQALEELTTELRENAETLAGPADSSDLDAFRDRCQSSLLNLEEHLESSGATDAWTESIEQALPTVTQLASQLGTVAESGNDQTRRLNELGTAFAGLLGLEYDADQIASVEMAASTEDADSFAHVDPFATGEEAEPVDESLATDPFETVQADPVQTGADTGQGFLSSPTEPEYDPWNDDESPAAGTVADEQPAVADVPEDDESDVIDLTAYGAEKTDAQEVEEIIDLSAYDAVRIDDDPAPASPVAEEAEEPVHELAEFDAVRID
ncbi:MAG: hypothetical protein GY838_02560 [bacterium]|nr:hypothetical protein [bacterium]